jgi:RHS repeat-associated protein
VLIAGWPLLLAAQISVTPDNGVKNAIPNQTGLSASFTLRYTGSGNKTLYLFCYPSGSVSSCSPSQTVMTIPPNMDIPTNATWATGAVTGSGVINFKACDNSSCSQGQDYGNYNVTVAFNGPVISVLPTNGDDRDISKCVQNCFDGVMSYTTVPYYSSDIPHSVQLTYRSGQAHPMVTVQVDAIDTSTVNPVKMSIQLFSAPGFAVTFTNGSTQIFYNWVSHPGDGNVNRLAAEFDASNLTTGAYTYTVAVRSYRSDGSFRENDVPIRFLVANEASSPFGAGWSIVGIQRLYTLSSSNIAITDGTGSISYFGRSSVSCPQGTYICYVYYSSPAGDYTTLEKDSIYTGPSCPGPPTCIYYKRSYPAGSPIFFNTSGRMTEIGGGLVFGTPGKAPTFIPGATFGYNASNLLVAITDTTGKTDSLRYDASNHLRAIKDPGGRVDSFTVDASGNLTMIMDWAVRTTQPKAQPVFLQYDTNHRLIHWTDRLTAPWDLTYDFAGKVATITAPQIHASGQAVRPLTTYVSLEHNVLIDPASGQGSSANPGANVDTAAVRAKVTNALGYATTYALDRFGAPTLIQEPLGRTSRYSRDVNSALTRSVAPSGHVIKFSWNGPDLIQRVDSMTSDTINYAYTSSSSAFLAHRMTIMSGGVDSVVNHWTLGGAAPITLDSTHKGGSGWLKFTSGADGRICTVVDPGGHTTSCHFTASGFQNTDSISYTLGTVRYQYDGHGQRVMTINQVNDTTRTSYDSIGRITRTIGPLNEIDSLYYGDSLHFAGMRDAKGQVYWTWLNALGWTDSTKDPAGGIDRYVYDVNGNQRSWTNRNGQTIAFTYDSLDELRSVVADGKTTTYFVDPSDHFVTTSNGESTDTLWSDAADRVSRIISCRVLANGNAPQCFRDSSVYEFRGHRTKGVLTAPGLWGATQFLLAYHYDIHELLDTLTPGRLDWQTAQPISFVYNAEGMDSVRTLTGLNNLKITHTYPWTHRTDQVQFSDGTLAALGIGYNFDNAGRMATGIHGANPDTSRTVIYDRHGQISQYGDTVHQYQDPYCWYDDDGFHCAGGTDTKLPLSSSTYSYDSVWNRRDPSAPNGGLDPANRLRRWQSYRMDYDAVGNMIVKRTLSLTDTTRVLRRDSLYWSTLGRLDSVRTRDSTGVLTGRVIFGYDAWGRRVRKSSAVATTRYLWEGDDVVAQLDTAGSLVSGYSYYQDLDNIAAALRRDRADSTYYYFQDYSHNVLALLSHTGAGNTIDNSYRYEPFGSTQGNNPNPVPNSLQFAGREYDVETGLYYDRARYLDPTLGRFISEDPLGLGGGLNAYAFVGNDPVNGWDPSGMRCHDWSIHQEKFRDKFIHFALGDLVAVGSALTHARRWRATMWGALLGLAHEGPWGKLGSPVRPLHGWIGDHDLWGWSHGAKGAPCAGLFDTFFFVVGPVIYDIFLAEKFQGPPDDDWGNPVPPMPQQDWPEWYPSPIMVPLPHLSPRCATGPSGFCGPMPIY